MTKKKTAKKKPEPKGEHGGRRSGTGKPSWFRGKSASSKDPMFPGVRNSASVRLTPIGWEILDAKTAELSAQAEREEEMAVSQATAIETLIRLFGKRLTLNDVKRASAQG